MRIYIAGFYATHGVGTAFSRVSADSSPAWVLESYHYMNPLKEKLIRSRNETVFMDSGAFSMFTQKVKVDLPSYALYLQEKQDIIHIASNLDEIGTGKEKESYQNQKQLERLGAKIQPVHHARDADEWLQRYLDEGYDYIFLGGMVPESTPYLTRWLDRVWGKYLLNSDGTAKIKVHGFGLTVIDLMQRYPWFSVDSTSWVMTSRFGSVYLDFPDGRILKVVFSDQSPKNKDFDAHYISLAPPVQEAVRRRIEELGFKVEDLRTNYGWRDRFNIEFFKRFQERPTKCFSNLEKGLFDA